jgi:signal transduction histidine kinase
VRVVNNDGRWQAGQPENGASRDGPDGARLAAERAALAAERQQLERARSELLSTVSHELRTPLTLIRTSIGLLLDSEPEPAMRTRLLRNIKQSADHMHALVTDLLELARLQSGHAELQVRYVDVGELVTQAGTMIKPLLEGKHQALAVAMPTPAPKILGDPRRLEQVLLNLLGNAHKFAPPDSRIRVAVSEDERTVTLAVADQGPGIPPAAVPRLFEQFYTRRTSSPSRNIGAGLGLPIARGVVEAHGGRIWVESAVGFGSIFSIVLPKEGPGKEATDEDPGGG